MGGVLQGEEGVDPPVVPPVAVAVVAVVGVLLVGEAPGEARGGVGGDCLHCGEESGVSIIIISHLQNRQWVSQSRFIYSINIM